MDDTFTLLNLSGERKDGYVKEIEKQHYLRLMAPYSKQKASPGGRGPERMQFDRKRQEAEDKLREDKLKEGKPIGLMQLYPLRASTEDYEARSMKYERFLEKAQELQNEFTHGKARLTFIDREFDNLINGYVDPSIKKSRPSTSYLRKSIDKPKNKNYEQSLRQSPRDTSAN